MSKEHKGFENGSIDQVVNPASEPIALVVSSTAFKNGEAIPAKYGCDGDNINPAVQVEYVPANTRSFTLIVEDRSDQDQDTGVCHWILWNIPESGVIAENSIPGEEGTNSFGNRDYVGPCGPDGQHQYHFTMFAVDTRLHLHHGANKEAVMAAMTGHLVAAGELVGVYNSSCGSRS